MLTLLRRHSYFFLSTILTLSVSLVVGFVLIETASEENVLSNLVVEHSTEFLLSRLVVYTTLIECWPIVLKRVEKQNPENKNKRHYLIILIFAIAVYELVIVQRLPIKIFYFVGA